MKWKTLLFIFLTSFLFLAFAVKPSASQTSSGFKWSPNIHFKLPAYGTTIAFNNYIYMDNFTWDNVNATQITFNNIRYEGEPETCSHFTITVQNANLTVTRLLHDHKFEAELDGQTGTVAQLAITISIYNRMPGTVSIAGLPITTPCSTRADFNSYDGNCWYYDTTTNTVHVKAILHSPTAIYIDWDPAPAPITPAPPTPAPPTPAPPHEITTPFGTIPTWQILILIIIIAGFLLLLLRRR